MNVQGKSIVLIGMMGAGKSCVGRCLERSSGFALLDVDEIVASKFGMSIPEIFATHGEDKFREAETEALRALPVDRPTIVVAGGGIVLRAVNVDLLKRLGTVVWLDADEETLFQRATRTPDRPLLRTENPRETFSQLFKARRAIYARIADVRVDTSRRSEEEVAEVILEAVGVSAPGYNRIASRRR